MFFALIGACLCNMVDARDTYKAPVKAVNLDSISAWFASTPITAGGLVTPADSLVTLTSDKDFHLWSWRMFLWLMSQNEQDFVFDSSGFYDLSEDNKLLSNTPGSDNVRFIRTGQAGMMAHGVLMSQSVGVTPTGSLVYYGIHVNDTFAYYSSGFQNQGPLSTLTDFPTSQSELTKISNYANTTYGATLQNPNTLAMELKSSWVKVASAASAPSYLTTTAEIPVYIKSADNRTWTWDGKTKESATLAMVGFHVVGSTAGHPEMVWATFEHNGNSPDANYQANATLQETFASDGTLLNKSADWLFYEGTSKQSQANIPKMNLTTKTTGSIVIQAVQGETISAASTYRVSPFGNPTSDDAGNTLLASINENIQGQLLSGDLRKNYFLVGSVWTKNGVPGQGGSLPELAGSTKLANTTMETFTQNKDCFSCHTTQHDLSLSHILDLIQPLSPLQNPTHVRGDK
ncbi:MAG: hypothetical protein COA42_11640 [Alteromonadaceae bacterium]|nr:MAG: hypothetical protein COA42_11640 [Alteromonadaceae bacterium]